MNKRTWLFVTVVFCFGFEALLVILRPTLGLLLHTRIERFLADRFQSQVSISEFRFSFRPLPKVTIVGLTLRHHNRSDIAPLLHIAELSLTPDLTSLLRPKLRFASVQVNGLELTFPPRAPTEARKKDSSFDLPAKFPLLVAELTARNVTITLLPARFDKRPLVLMLGQLKFRNLNFDAPSEFEAQLTNAVPRGEIHVKGTFGPWHGLEPTATPIQADYEFLHANLGTIRGLRGMLSSTGNFAGPLDYLEVHGNTVTPDFTLARVGNPLELRTEFSAVVDGTNGNTYLHSIAAHFLSTTLYVNGEVVDLVSGIPARTIILQAESNSARAEDLIRLAVKTPSPVLKGPVRLKARIRIPEQDKDLSDRLDVAASFLLAPGEFGNPSLQGKVDALSRKGLGQPKDMSIAHVPSRLDASIHTVQGIVHFSKIAYAVPGAHLNVLGSYTLGKGTLNFRGYLFLDASLSQTTTGIKSLLLKPVDPFFRSPDGGTKLPVKITGTKDHPIFGLDRNKGDKRTVSRGIAANLR